MHQEIELIGNLGQTPELRKHNDRSVVNLNVATNRRYNTETGQVTETVWFNVAVWGAQADTCALYLRSGRQVFIKGRMKAAKVFEKADGTFGASLDVDARMVRFLGPSDQEITLDTTDEIPFDDGE